ncbi:MAG: aspartate kinase [Phycisphaeraceae bacterium]|nr:aspartate kinase [Phycisphaeraceae bacterium]
MGLVVQKFGGTSVGDATRIRRCAKRVAAAREDGREVVVVVSAMGHTTDELLQLAAEVSTSPGRRDLDLLLSTGEAVTAALMSMALRDLGHDAVPLTGGLLGIRTDRGYGSARIVAVETDAIARHLREGRIVVAAGFQGTAPDHSITTLGRGGSDTTAVALAAALGVREETGGVCEIYTDVDGVYTADPRIVPGARRLARISYEEMSELASLGAGVLHTRAVLFGQRYEVPIHVRHSAREAEGTMVVRESIDMERKAVVGCALTPDLARIAIRGIPNRPGVQGTIFRVLAEASLLVDDIIQNESADTADIAFTVAADRLGDVKIAAERAAAEVGAIGGVSVEVGLAKVSVVGVGMRTHTGVAATMFESLAAAGIRIANITTSEIKISCIVPKERGAEALAAVHDAFGLGSAAVPAPARVSATV